MGVNVLQVGGEGKLAALDFTGEGGKAGHDLACLVEGEQADLGEHAGVGLAGRDVLPVQALVETDGLGKCFDALIGSAAESAAPGFVAHDGSSVPLLLRPWICRTYQRICRARPCRRSTSIAVGRARPI